MKKRLVNLERSVENIADQYQNIYEGLQKDAGQNSWDARTTYKGKDWKLTFEYVPGLNALIIEDFGTTGMNEKKWDSYQSLWDTSKSEAELGARGQGKFLFHFFSSKKLVLTETIDASGRYRFSYGNQEGWDDDKTLHDFFSGVSPLNHQGTRIWIVDVREDLKGELLDWAKFMRYIETTWWEIIRNYGATFVVNFDGTPRTVTLTDKPTIVNLHQGENDPLPGLGIIRNLQLYHVKEDLPEDIRGIAVQRGGMTVLRIPIHANEGLKEKLFGFINFDDDLESELKRCELPNHFGFNNRKAWNHVREYARRKTDEFVLSIAPPPKQPVISSQVANEAVKIVNTLVEQYAPDLLSGPPGKGGKKPIPPHGARKQKPPVRIDIFSPNEKIFDFEQTLTVRCEIVNTTTQDEHINLNLNVAHEAGMEKYTMIQPLTIGAMSRHKVHIPLIDFEKNDPPGRYYGEAVLTSQNPGGKLDAKDFVVWMHQDPPDRGGKAFVSGFRIAMGRTGTNAVMSFAKWRNLEINDKGIIHVVWDHPDFVRVRDRAQSPRARNKEIILYLVKRGIDEAQRRLLINRTLEGNVTADDIQEVAHLCEEMNHDAVDKAND